MDRYDDTPRHDVEAQRRIDAALEQEDWERDPDYKLYQPDPARFRARVFQARQKFICHGVCECGGRHCERCAA